VLKGFITEKASQIIISYVNVSRMEPIITSYLEMRSPDSLKSKDDSRGLVVTECKIKQYQLNKFLYQFIGERWLWTDKLSWTDEAWKEYVESDQLRIWVACSKGAIAGYYELLKQDNGDVEIIYFGLFESFIGKGFGGYLLSEAIRSAWGWHGVKRVWVHTCTLDHPGALQNYLSRGMTLYRQEKEGEML
jgi:GNAT superfamily N-acetyltransferase